MREFTLMAADYPVTITPSVRHGIIKSAYFMDKREHLSTIKKINSLLRLRKKEKWDGRRIVVTGLTLEPLELIGIFEQFGISVCADDLAHELRQFRTDVPYFGKPLRSLARQWQVRSGCSLAFDPYKSRIKLVTDLVKTTGADGLVISLMKFCDPEEYDVPVIMEECKKQGIPLLCIEMDQQSRSFEQIRTRIQGFTEQL